VAAWGLFALAWAGRHGSALAAVGAGVLLGWCVFLSYGLPLLAVPALAIVWLTRGWRVLPWSIGGALAVAALFWAAGFAWWEAFPVLRERYYAGLAAVRPQGYWVWANLAAWTFTIGLATWAAFPTMVRAFRRRSGVAVVAMAAIVAILVATVSAMSKAEVERIWLPFTIWALAAGAFLPVRWRPALLATQVATAVAVQGLLLTRW
jgi:hypothetical protein